jgi:hypothetical protein
MIRPRLAGLKAIGGRRVVSREWAELATHENPAVKAPNEGYHWHLNQLPAAGRT